MLRRTRQYWERWSAELNPLARRTILAGATVVAALLVLQLGRYLLSEHPTNPAELEALTFYGERVHNAATFSLTSGVLQRVPTGDCTESYRVAGSTVAPTSGTARLMLSCRVSLDKSGLPVVTVTHRNGTVVSVP
ncbi:MAG TPA: hypothetical protein VF171_09470 [Trueperaceae bacterium]